MKTEQLIKLFSKFAIILGVFGTIIYFFSLISQFCFPIKMLQNDMDLANKMRFLTLFHLILFVLLVVSGKGALMFNNKCRILLIICSFFILVNCFISLFTYIMPLVKVSGFKASGVWRFVLMFVYSIINILFFTNKRINVFFSGRNQ